MKTFVLRTLLVLVALIDGLFYGLEKAAYALGEKANRSLFKYMHRQGMVLMANYFADVQNVVNGPAYGQPLATRVKTNKHGGRLRYFEAFFVVPAGTLAIADKIIWGKLPVKSRVLGHLSRLRWSNGAASSTLNLGDNVTAARHLAATAVTTAGTATPDAAEVNGATFETSDDSNTAANAFTSATDDCTLISTVAGASLAAGQVISLVVVYVQD